MKYLPFRVVPLFFILFLCGCSSFGVYNAATGKKEFIVISTPEEITMGNSIHQDLSRQYKVVDYGPQFERVNRIGQRLVLVSDRQDYAYKFHIIDKDEMNAFTTPGGNIYFYTGLLDKLRTDDEVAAVLAHEIGHCAARHTVKKFQAALSYNLIAGVLLSRVDQGASRQVMGLTSNAVMSLIFSAYGRQDEYQSDQLGLKYMYLSGYDPNAVIKTFEVLKSGSNGPDVPLILRSHPHLDERIEAVKKQIPQLPAVYGARN